MKNVPIGRSAFRMWLLRSPLGRSSPSGRSINSTEAATPGKPLSLRQATAIVLTISCFTLLLTAVGIHELLFGKKYSAVLCCILAIGWLGPLAVYIVLYLQVKKGKHVVLNLNPGFFQRPSQVPLFVSAFFAGLLTLLVTAVNYMSFVILYPIFKTMTQRLAMGGINLFLWLVVAFVWYRLIVAESQKPKLNGSVVELTEGVWPPSPSALHNPDNKD